MLWQVTMAMIDCPSGDFTPVRLERRLPLSVGVNDQLSPRARGGCDPREPQAITILPGGSRGSKPLISLD